MDKLLFKAMKKAIAERENEPDQIKLQAVTVKEYERGETLSYGHYEDFFIVCHRLDGHKVYYIRYEGFFSQFPVQRMVIYKTNKTTQMAVRNAIKGIHNNTITICNIIKREVTNND